jgi:hypothetical protein
MDQDIGAGVRPVERAAAFALTICATALLASCTSSPPPPSPPTPSPVSAERICLQLSDVGTLVFNMRQARDAGRIPGEEYQGAMYLAASMLTHVDDSDDSAVNAVLAELQAAAGVNAVNPDSAEWAAAFTDVSDSCAAVLGEFGVVGWVGG